MVLATPVHFLRARVVLVIPTNKNGGKNAPVFAMNQMQQR
jgi:hypothetical protein